MKKLVFCLCLLLTCVALLCACSPEQQTPTPELGSPTLIYELNSDGNGYTVIGVSDEVTTDLVIPSHHEGLPVTAIGEDAFDSYGSEKLEEYGTGNRLLESVPLGITITVPETVTEIGAYAFEWAVALREIIFKGTSRLKSIGEKAFEGCVALRSIALPEGVTSIGANAFATCASLTHLTLPASVVEIGENAFDNCPKLIEICNLSALPVTAGSSEYGASSVKNVYTPSKGESMLKRTEDGCLYFDNGSECCLVDYEGTYTDLVLPQTFGGKPYEILPYAFLLTRLKSLTLPDGMTSIPERNFYLSLIERIIIPEGVTSIGHSAFSHCSELQTVVLPASIESLDMYAFSICARLTDVTFAAGCHLQEIGYGAFSECKSLTSITLPDGVTSIGNSAFSDCTSLTSISIPDGVTSIGNGAFFNCSSLKSISIPKGVSELPDGILAGCASLESVTLPHISDGGGNNILFYSDFFLELFGTNPFEGAIATSNLFSPGNTYYLPATLEQVSISKGILPSVYFYGLSTVKHITIGAEVSFLSITSLFADLTALESITVESGNALYHSSDNCLIETATGKLIATCKSSVIPTDGSVTSIGEYAFCNASWLTSLTIPASITTIADGAFTGCTSLTDISISEDNTSYHWVDGYLIETASGRLIWGNASAIIPDDGSVTSIAPSAFKGCLGLRAIVIPESVATIGENAFFGCESLVSLTISNGVAEIGSNAFADCKSLTSLVIPGSVTNIDSGLFGGCEALTSIVLLHGVTSIGECAFLRCTSLTTVTIPVSVTRLEAFIFYDCASLTDIIYEGSIADWQAIQKSDTIDWDASAGEYVITCTDGRITKNGIPEFN